MGRLAVGAVNPQPLLGDLDDGLAFPEQQRVQRDLQSGLGVVETAENLAGLSAQHPRMVQAQRRSRLLRRPAAFAGRVADQLQQTGLDDRVDSRRLAAGPGRCSAPKRFSLVHMESEGLLGHRRAQPLDLLRAASSSTASGLLPGRPIVQASARASNAPC